MMNAERFCPHLVMVYIEEKKANAFLVIRHSIFLVRNSVVIIPDERKKYRYLNQA